jgi:hypothetical protein
VTTRANGVLRQSATAIEPTIVDWTAKCLNLWQPGLAYTAGQRVRPTIANGFEYTCTTAGQSDGEFEPSWDQADTIGNTIADGSVVWTCAALSGAGLKRTISASTWPSPPAAITLSGQATVNTFANQQAYVVITGGTPGSIYRLTNHIVFSDGTADDATVDVVIN